MIDVAASCRAELRWIRSGLTINTGAARAAPVNLERRALDDRIRSVVELRDAGRRFLATRRLILYRTVSLVGSEMSPEAYAASIRALFADMVVPANYPAALHAEMTRWAAEP